MKIIEDYGRLGDNCDMQSLEFQKIANSVTSMMKDNN